MHLSRILDDVVRKEGRQVLASLVRLTGDFDVAEDALQEAYARALTAWARSGVPSRPGAWLHTVARRVVVDRSRRDRSAELPADLEAPVVEFEEPA
jgi:RNA polymerase sigma-70 factor, ECF subfamily